MNSPGVAPLTCVLGGPPVHPWTLTWPSLFPTQAYRRGGRCPKSSRAHHAWAATALVSVRVAQMVLGWVFLTSGCPSLSSTKYRPRIAQLEQLDLQTNPHSYLSLRFPLLSVTARDYVGGRASGGNDGTGTSCTRRGLREKRRREMYVLSKKGAADYGAWGHYDPPKHWISLFSFVFLLFVPGQGRRSTRARGG